MDSSLTFGISDLPPEIVIEILRYVVCVGAGGEPSAFASVSLVCKQWLYITRMLRGNLLDGLYRCKAVTVNSSDQNRTESRPFLLHFGGGAVCSMGLSWGGGTEHNTYVDVETQLTGIVRFGSRVSLVAEYKNETYEMWELQLYPVREQDRLAASTASSSVSLSSSSSKSKKSKKSKKDADTDNSAWRRLKRQRLEAFVSGNVSLEGGNMTEGDDEAEQARRREVFADPWLDTSLGCVLLGEYFWFGWSRRSHGELRLCLMEKVPLDEAPALAFTFDHPMFASDPTFEALAAAKDTDGTTLRSQPFELRVTEDGRQVSVERFAWPDAGSPVSYSARGYINSAGNRLRLIFEAHRCRSYEYWDLELPPSNAGDPTAYATVVLRGTFKQFNNSAVKKGDVKLSLTRHRLTGST